NHSAGQQAIEVVVESEGHHDQKQRKTDTLPELHRALGNRPAFDDLDRIVHQVPAVEQRNRQQVQHAKADADEREESEIRDPAHLRRLAGEIGDRSEEHTSELQSRSDLVCRLLLEKKKKQKYNEKKK